MSFQENVAHIVYASDERFSEILGVSLVSLYENSQDMDDIIVYILDNGICQDNKNRLTDIAKIYGRTLPRFIKSKNITEELQMEVAIDRGSLSQYARLFVSSVLPQNLERILYLDCDIIVMKSIHELWNLNLHGKIVAALMDAFSRFYRKNIDLEEQDIMFNSGIMLIDLKKWKKEAIEEKLLRFITNKHGKIQQGDQGAFNAVLSKNVYCFEPRFNSVTIFFDFSYKEMIIYRKPPMFYEENLVKEAVENPNIVHFTTSFLSQRPWMTGCKHKYAEVWMKYKKLSPWRDTELWKNNKPFWKYVGIKIFNLIPRRIAVRIAGIIQAYGRPIKNRII